MTDRNATDTSPEALVDLPIQPTGSGVADLEVAYEQMKLTEVDDPELASTDAGVAYATNMTSSDRDADVAESEAHPS